MCHYVLITVACGEKAMETMLHPYNHLRINARLFSFPVVVLSKQGLKAIGIRAWRKSFRFLLKKLNNAIIVLQGFLIKHVTANISASALSMLTEYSSANSYLTIDRIHHLVAKLSS